VCVVVYAVVGGKRKVVLHSESYVRKNKVGEDRVREKAKL